MVYMENAGLIEDMDEIKQIVNETYDKPTIDRLMFLETLPKEGREGQLFPCYIEGYTEEKTENGETKTTLRCVIIQCAKQEFGMVRVNIPQEQFNCAKRFWDKPPKKAVRDETPWVVGGDDFQ